MRAVNPPGGRVSRPGPRMGQHKTMRASGAGLLALLSALVIGALGLSLSLAAPTSPPPLGPVVDLDDRSTGSPSPSPTTTPPTTSPPTAGPTPSAPAPAPRPTATTGVRPVAPPPARIPYPGPWDDDDRDDDDRDDGDWDDDRDDDDRDDD